ncbi:EamA family transporter [Arthrobacter sp. NamB2]|uniref:DMT family transporter n=1 Tax=Arthrobacter sp. NamB2 TaxID=2576035 RepID=UPI0010C99C99|nr:EamA family transporter [Arthrobacter sp. NamB2]TKV28828.1 EamA family transporter [Arthrobacter sp. NamB2]
MLSERNTVGVVLVLLAAAIWGTVGPAQVLSGTEADPGALGALRLLVGGAVLSLPALRRVPWRALAKRDTWPWVLAAAMSTAMYQATFLYAVELTGAAIGTTVALGFAPFATGLFAWWWAGQKPDRRWLIGTLAAVLGCALILAPSGEVRVDAMGVVFAVVSGCCYGAYTVSAKRFINTGIAPTATIAITLVIGGMLLAPLIVWRSEHLLEPNTLLFVAWIGVIGTAAAYLLFGRGLNLISATVAGTLSLVEPLTAALLGVLVLGESMTPFMMLGSVLLLTGILVISLPMEDRRRRPAKGAADTEEVATPKTLPAGRRTSTMP